MKKLIGVISVVSAVFLFIISISPVLAFELDTDGAKVKAEEYLNTIIEGNADKAFDEAFSPEAKLFMGSNFANMKAQFNLLLNLFGAPNELEFIREEQLSNRLIRLIYFLYTDLNVVAFDFYYYESNGELILVKLSYDNEFERMYPKK
ncbi:MAG: hypothetical protein IIA70_01050 [Proteobacteria bacterium]|nr:hypothetical protein [Pseudomonadota bacterium]